MIMNVICIYQVAASRSPKVLKLLRKYLFQLQKSVFAGYLNPNQFSKLQKELEGVIKEDDQIRLLFTYERTALHELIMGKAAHPYNII